jgi:hypothetical protein
MNTTTHDPVTHALLGDSLPRVEAICEATGQPISVVVRSIVAAYLAGQAMDPAVLAQAEAAVEASRLVARARERVRVAGVVFSGAIPAGPSVQVRYDVSARKYLVAVVDEAGVVRGRAIRGHTRRDTAERAAEALARREGWACEGRF